MEKYRIELTEAKRVKLLGIITKGKSPAPTITHVNMLLDSVFGEHAELRMTSV